jgi:hypothetical protein
MADDEQGKKLPLRGIHEFLFEISSEWSSFRTGSLVTAVLSGLLILLLLPRLIVFQWRPREILETLILGGIFIVLSYNLVIGYRQHQFYKRWERKIGLLVKTEEDLLGKDDH